MAEPIILQTPKSVPPTEWSPEFMQHMINASAVSYHKYGPVAEAFPHKVSALKSAGLRVKKYRETGNTEYLVDAVNFLMFEFMHPSMPNAGFRPDSEKSPGRVWNPDDFSFDEEEEVSERANDGTHQW